MTEKGPEEHRKPCFPLNSVRSPRSTLKNPAHALSNVNFVSFLQESSKVLVRVYPLVTEQRTMYCMCKWI